MCYMLDKINDIINKRRKIEKADDEDGVFLEKRKANPHIPNDILFDIISRLPPKSLHRFKSVSKEWCSLIQDQTFEDFYFDYRRRQANEARTIRLFGRFGDENHYYLINHAGEAFHINSYFFASRYNDPLVPACNGLFCFLGCKTSFKVWNPATKQIITLPKPGLLEGVSEPNIRLGFGFDTISRKYKVVFFCVCLSHSPIQVLTLGDKEWRSVGRSRHQIGTKSMQDKVIHINGVLYWLNTRRQRNYSQINPRITMTTFNLADENFGEVQIPGDDAGFTNFGHFLYELEGHLCLIGHKCNTLDMWVLITNNQQEQQWVNQRVVLPFQILLHLDSVLPIRDGEILVQCCNENCFYLCFYDQEGKLLKTTRINGLPPYFYVAGNCYESLVNLENYM